MKKILVSRNVAILLCLFCTVGLLTGCKNSKASANTNWNTQADNAVTSGLEAAMQYDRYEYATGAQENKEILCFYSGTDSTRYILGNDEINMEITKMACSYAYEQYLRILAENLPKNFAESIRKFKMVNVYEDTAYMYDIITGQTDIVLATGLVSSLEIDTSITSGDTSESTAISQKWTMQPKS